MQSSNRGVLDAEFSVYVGNLDPETPLSEMEELLYELFLQAGPLSHVLVPFNKETGKHKCYGFVEFLHQESVPYAIELMSGIRLCGRLIIVKPMQPGRTSNSSLNQQQQAAVASMASTAEAMDVQVQEPTAMTVGQDTLPPPLVPNPFLVPPNQNLNLPATGAKVNPFFAALSQGIGLRPSLAPAFIPPHSSLLGEPPSGQPPPIATPPSLPPSSSHLSFPLVSGQPVPLFPSPPPHPQTFSPLPLLVPSANESPVPFPNCVLPFGPPPFPQPPSLVTPPHLPFQPHQNEQDHFPVMNVDVPPPPSSFPSELQPDPSVPDLPFYRSCTPPPTPSTTSHFQLHESRLHASDRPSWMKDEVKGQILSYHLKELGTSLQSLQRTLTKKMEAPNY